jgi:hypothetical protein
MNRLIILGNGFDLAHGIKTSYHDFILSYLANFINLFYTHGNIEDELLSIKFKEHYTHFSDKPNLINAEMALSTLDNLKKHRNIDVKINSLLFDRSLSKITTMNWVDLEIEYFNVLLATKHGSKDYNQLEAIQKVNSQLTFLKSKLEEYLIKQQMEFSNLSDREPLVDCFCDKIYKHELVTVTIEENMLPESLYFLNFNYTNTFEDYYRYSKAKIPSDFNYIHGNLHGVHGKVIFGFGDELDKRYLEFEDEKNNELFKHIKSFEYLKTKNYYLLTRFIEAKDFQVHIYGHSCGLSDRTMLNQIFEHENCKSIKIYYYKKADGSNDHTEKTYEISRHFKDKGMMRKKVVPFDLSQEMPQPSKPK